MKEKEFFWWSHKKEAMGQRHMPVKTRINFCKIDGKIVQYNVCSQSKDHGCDWDDMQYLGYGEYSHTVT